MIIYLKTGDLGVFLKKGGLERSEKEIFFGNIIFNTSNILK